MTRTAPFIKSREPIRLRDFLAYSRTQINESISRTITSIVNEQITVAFHERPRSILQSGTDKQQFYELSIATSEISSIMTVAIAPAQCRRLCSLSFGSSEEWSNDTTIALTQFERSFCLLLLTSIARQLNEIFSRQIDKQFIISNALKQNDQIINEQQNAEFIAIHFSAKAVTREHEFLVILNSKCLEQMLQRQSMEGRTEDEIGNWQRALHASVNEIPVSVSALIRFSIEAGALSQVQNGQVIKIPGSSWRRATLLAKSFEAYTGEIGRNEDRVTFRVA